jgi:hypothetical protein
MRFRTDGSHGAETHALWLAGIRKRVYICRRRKDHDGGPHDRVACGHHGHWFKRYPPAKPGDTWRSRWYKANGEGPIAGYQICCPKCGEVHSWCTANNCSAPRRTFKWQDSAGAWHESSTCEHSGVSSCWQWTGSAEDNALSAQPSLLASGACGWHGFLTNGVLIGD